MNVKYIVYNPSSGKITGCFDTDPEFIELQLDRGNLEYLLGTANPITQYVQDGKISNRPQMPFAIDTQLVAIGEKATLSLLPVGVEVRIDTDVVVVNDGVLEVTFDTSGVYIIQLILFPFLDKEVRITCS